MEGFFRTTPFGQLLRLCFGTHFLKYPDEIDPQLWKRSVDGGEPLAIRSLTDGEVQAAPLEKEKLDDDLDVVVIGWYGPNDPENPQNWPASWKHIVTGQLCLVNFAVYIASSIYVPGEAAFIKEFGVSEEVATLGLSLFTVGYGLGPMLWSPLSEIPKIGRSSIFFYTLLLFILFQLPVGYATSAPMFLVFRTVTGFLGSPCLATGGGTVADIYPPTQIMFAICIWSSLGVLGPVFGPLIGGYVAPVKGWQWTIWIFTWMCSAILILMFFCLPETSAANILHKRASRLRTATGDERLKSQSEIDAAHHTTKDHLTGLARAFTLTFSEPIVFVMDMYTGLLYGVLFIWFESFPLVFGDIYGFTSGQQGLVFLGIFVGAFSTAPLFMLWIKRNVVPKLMEPDFKPEMVLPPTFVGCFSLPICLFWFGWSARASVHWIMPIIGMSYFGIGVVTLFNSVFNYLALSYPADAASIFAGNALFRASFGASFPLFARSLFKQLGIGPGNSLLGGIAACFVPVTFILYRYGERIRHMSKNARHDV